MFNKTVKKGQILFSLFFFFISANAFGHDSLASLPLSQLQQGWAAANYQLSGDKQIQKFESLIVLSESYLSQEPENPELLIWDAIIRSTYAGQAGGLNALGLVKAARKSLQKSLALDDVALMGSAHTSLGTLYAQVPSWPIAFGSDKKARKHLQKALQINPEGIDSNYFYASFLLAEKDYDGAKAAALKAQAAHPRPGREVADEGRQIEINRLLAKIAAKR